MRRRVLLVALGLGAGLGWAESEGLRPHKGRWAFDFTAPRKATCAQVDTALVRKAAKARVACVARKSEDAYDQNGGEWFTCEGKGFARAVFKTKEQCQSNLANERVHGPQGARPPVL